LIHSATQIYSIVENSYLKRNGNSIAFRSVLKYYRECLILIPSWSRGNRTNCVFQT